MNPISLAEIKERISISSIVFDRYAPLNGKAFETLAGAGIMKIELQENPYQYDLADTGSMRYYFDLCRKTGISIIAYHARFTMPTGIESEEELFKLTDICKRQIETMQEAGAYIWSSHAMYADKAVFKLHESLLRFVEGTKVKLAIENFNASQPIFSLYSAGKLHKSLLAASDDAMVKQAVDDFRKQWQERAVKDRMEFLRELDHPQMGILLDIGHARDEVGRNPMTLTGEAANIIRQCGGKLFHLHLHGFKEGVDHFPPLSEGDEMQWEEIFRTLQDIDYPGYLNFESLGLPAHQDTIAKVAMMPEAIFGMMGK